MILPQAVLVTGSSSGIGRSIAETLARKGHTVLATMRNLQGKNAAAAAELQRFARREDVPLHVFEMDVTEDASVAIGVHAALGKAGRIDVVVNNAGVMTIGLGEALTVAQMRAMFEVNVLGAMRVNQAVLPHMRERGSGYLIYISSASGSVTHPFMGMFGATKAALGSMAEAIHFETFSLGIDTTVVQAGMVATEMRENVRENVDDGARESLTNEYGSVGVMAQGFAGSLGPRMASPVAARPEDIASLVAALIDLPHGKRPLYQPTGPLAEALGSLNDARSEAQGPVLEFMGLGPLLSR